MKHKHRKEMRQEIGNHRDEAGQETSSRAARLTAQEEGCDETHSYQVMATQYSPQNMGQAAKNLCGQNLEGDRAMW